MVGSGGHSRGRFPIALAASSLGLAASIGLSFVERSALAWICLAVAAVIASGLTLLYNRRLAAR